LNRGSNVQAIEKAQEALNKFETERDIAQYIKKAFDESNGLTWHCIVGKSFGSFVTHDRFVSYGELWHKIK
jgi:dynein light chain LC8-type